MSTDLQFTPVLLGGDANAYGMARSFFEEYGKTSHTICKGAFHICQHSKLMSIDVTEPNLEDDEVFVRTLRAFASAAWKDPRTLHLTVYVCDVCFGTLQLTLRFDDDALTVAAKKNAEWFLNEYQGYATSLT